MSLIFPSTVLIASLAGVSMEQRAGFGLSNSISSKINGRTVFKGIGTILNVALWISSNPTFFSKDSPKAKEVATELPEKQHFN